MSKIIEYYKKKVSGYIQIDKNSEFHSIEEFKDSKAKIFFNKSVFDYIQIDRKGDFCRRIFTLKSEKCAPKIPSDYSDYCLKWDYLEMNKKRWEDEGRDE